MGEIGEHPITVYVVPALRVKAEVQDDDVPVVADHWTVRYRGKEGRGND